MKLHSLLDEAIDAWQGARAGVIDELDNFPGARFDWRPASGARSVEEMARHIMEGSLMMVGVLVSDSAGFAGEVFPKLIARYRKPIDGIKGKREIMAAMRRTL